MKVTGRYLLTESCGKPNLIARRWSYRPSSLSKDRGRPLMGFNGNPGGRGREEGNGSLGNWWHQGEGGLSSSSLLPPLPVLLLVECMGTLGVGACLVRQDEFSLQLVSWLLTPSEPGLDMLHWQEESVLVSSQPVERVSTFGSMWPLTVFKLTITSSFPSEAWGETLPSHKLGETLKMSV